MGHPFTCDYGRHIEIGNNVSINTNCILVDCNKIIIGDNVLITPGVQLNTASHPVELSEHRNFIISSIMGRVFGRRMRVPFVLVRMFGLVPMSRFLEVLALAMVPLFGEGAS